MITSIGIITLSINCVEKEEEFGGNWGEKEARTTMPDYTSQTDDVYNESMTVESGVWVNWGLIAAVLFSLLVWAGIIVAILYCFRDKDE